MLIEQAVPIIDVRRPDEWRKTGIIPGSHRLTFYDERGRYDVEHWLSELERIVSQEDPFVLVCAAGARTRSIGRILDGQLNYSQVHHLERGLDHGIRLGNPVVVP